MAAKQGAFSFIKTVTSGGTAEPLKASEYVCTFVRIQAEADNTNDIYIGGSDVDNTQAFLDAGDVVEFHATNGQPIDLSQVYIDADTDTEGVLVFGIR